jgi:hypothetical protein
MLPIEVEGTRRNVKDFGDRLRYAYGFNDTDTLFSFAAIFGNGISICGVVLDKPDDSTRNFRSEQALRVFP